MPELPEVETVRRVLLDWMQDRTIKMVRICYAPVVDYEDKEEFISLLTGSKIDDIDRKGKYLIFKLGDLRLVSHLRMEGKYYRVNNAQEYNNSLYYRKHTHVLFYLSDGSIILYHDVRKFGRFNLFKNETAMLKSDQISKLGLEPFDIKNGSYLMARIPNMPRTLTLKEMLLDQTIMLGIGNIYADEICFDCKLYPFTNVHDLCHEDCDKIVESSKKILNHAIELGGSTVHSFSFANGVDGKFQNELKVYGKEGQSCPVCGNIITKMKLSGRGTCFCSSCQASIKDNLRVIGVTGLIASGKSHVSKEIAKYGYTILDADILAHDCYNKDTNTYKKIIKLFGKEILDKDEISIAKVREIVKENKEKLKMLEDIIHPEVIKQIKEQIKDENKKFVLDVPLLFESGLDKACDATIFVTLNDSVRVKRLVARNTMSLEDAKSFNFDIEEAYKKIKKSTYVVDNSGDSNLTATQIKHIVAR